MEFLDDHFNYHLLKLYQTVSNHLHPYLIDLMSTHQALGIFALMQSRFLF